MTKQTWLKGAALVVMAALVLSGCSKKAEAQSSGSGGGSSRSSGRASPASDFSYDLTDDGRGIKITGYTGKGGAVVIPSTIEDMPVLEIGFSSGRGAFQGNPNSDNPNNRDAITSIVVPNSVEIIGEMAFGYIDELTRVTLPDGIKVLPNSAFASNRKLTSVNLPASLEILGSDVFGLCGELTELTIPESINGITFLNIVGNTREQNARTGNAFINNAFLGCGKLPIRTRQRIQSWGYTDEF